MQVKLETLRFLGVDTEESETRKSCDLSTLVHRRRRPRRSTRQVRKLWGFSLVGCLLHLQEKVSRGSVLRVRQIASSRCSYHSTGGNPRSFGVRTLSTGKRWLILQQLGN
jgi:hypothetical protein